MTHFVEQAVGGNAYTACVPPAKLHSLCGPGNDKTCSCFLQVHGFCGRCGAQSVWPGVGTTGATSAPQELLFDHSLLSLKTTQGLVMWVASLMS